MRLLESGTSCDNQVLTPRMKRENEFPAGDRLWFSPCHVVCSILCREHRVQSVRVCPRFPLSSSSSLTPVLRVGCRGMEIGGQKKKGGREEDGRGGAGAPLIEH